MIIIFNLNSIFTYKYIYLNSAILLIKSGCNLLN